MNILIVDDEAANQRLLSAILESEGHSVLKAADGAEAMAVLERQKVDAVISDILMPQMDGYRFCYEVRSSELFRDLPFIFYTSSYTSPADKKLGLEIGADKFLTKPVPASEIIQTLEEVTTKQRGQFSPIKTWQKLNLMKEYNQQLVAKLTQKNFELNVRNEELLRSEQRRLLQGTALETVANAVMITDLEGIILWVNPAFISLTGYTAGEVNGKTPNLLSSGRHDAEFYQNLWTIILEGRTWRGTFTNRRKDGSFYDDEQTITPVRSIEGTITHFVSIMNDVTDRKRGELALQESESQFRTMVNAIPQLAWVAHADGLIFWYNQRWYDYTGTAPEQMTGAGWQRLLDPDLLPKVMEVWNESIANGRPFDMEFPLRAADGHYGWFLTRVFPFKDATGEIVRWFGTHTDVSRKREADEEIRRLNATLEQRVAERTAELETANKELEAFSYSVSHDLRAPLRAVDGFSQVVLEDYGAQLPEEGRRDLETIRRGAQSMGVLIDDLLTFSRLSRIPLKKQEVDTGLLVRSVLGGLHAERKGRQIEIRILELPSCQADPALLRQAWINLLSNALKYTRHRQPGVIDIGCKLEQGESVYYVRDNGAGFDMQYGHKLFGVFQRLHGKDEFEGTGVGLAIVQRIIHRHGGRVWAEAALDRGATFSFTLKEET
jgi:PAS domain S-box-containing protein